MAVNLNQEHAEIPQYPEVEMVCEECKRKFTGQIGPIEPGKSYNLVEYIWPWAENSALRNMRVHHMTVRAFSRGHNSFDVELNGKIVGKVKMSSNVQRYESL